MSTTSRAIIVNNTDPRIKYSPPWDLHENKDVNKTVGNFGPTLNSVLHGTKTNGTLQFEFAGTQIALFGTTRGVQGRRSGNIDRTWTCFVDGKPSNSTPPNKFPRNNFEFCNAQDLADEQHILTVNVTSEGLPFWVDYISYIPSRSARLDDSLIRVSNADPDIHYDSGWKPSKGFSMTRTTGSSMSFDFIGQSLSWYGFILAETSKNTTSAASYVVDGLPPVSFNLTPGPVTLHNQLFFESDLPIGPHSIKVTFEGGQSSTPLTLTYMLVQNGTSVDPTLSPTPTPTSSSSSSTVKPTFSNSHSNINIGGIVGGSLAATFTLLLIATFIIRYRKQTRKRKNWTQALISRPFFPEVVAIEADKARTVSTQRFRPLSSTSLHVPHDLEPVHHNIRPQKSIRSAKRAYDEIDEKSSYYGGYQTWGQVKAMEAASESHRRDSYM